mgnify:CR=1 FL=1|tara:strand:- start:1220 stop:3409 length:2190 start_codon:yes stop_codon:yes gene_type:complete
MPHTKDPLVSESEKLLDQYHGERAEWATQAMEDDEFRNNQQWKASHVTTLESRAQSPIVDNVVHPAVEQAKALLTANKPKFQSTGRDDSDTKVGRIFSEIMSYIWDKSNGNVELKQIVDDYYVKGMGVMQAYMDPMKDFGRGEVCFHSVDPLDVYIDPNSSDTFCRDASNIIIAKLFTGAQLMDLYPQTKEIIDNLEQSRNDRYPSQSRRGQLDQVIGPIQSDNYSTDEKYYEVIDRYQKVKLPYYHIIDTVINQEYIFNIEDFAEYSEQPAIIMVNQEGTQYITEKQSVDELIAVYEATGGTYHYMMDMQTGQPTLMPGEEHAEAIPGSQTEIRLTKKGLLIAEGAIISNEVIVDRVRRILCAGGVMLYDYILDIEEYPIVTLMNRHNRNPYPMSDVRFIKPIQEYINKITSLIIAHASSSTNTKLLIPRGSMNRKQLEEEWSRAGTGVIEFDPELGTPIVAGPIPLPNELYKNREDAKQSIYHIIGIHPLQSGDPSAAPSTYKGTVAIDEYAQRRIKSKLDDIDEALNQIAKVIVQFIQQTYTDQKIVRIMKPDGRMSQVTLNQPIYDDLTNEILGRINDVTIGNYDLIVVSGSTLPSNRWARFEYYMQLYQSGIIDAQEVLEQTEVADTEGVMERTSIINQQKQIIAQLEEELKNTRGDLQTAQRESTHDRKRVEIEKFKTKLNSASNKSQSAVNLFEARLNDELQKTRQDLRQDEQQTKEAIAVS